MVHFLAGHPSNLWFSVLLLNFGSRSEFTARKTARFLHFLARVTPQEAPKHRLNRTVYTFQSPSQQRRNFICSHPSNIWFHVLLLNFVRSRSTNKHAKLLDRYISKHGITPQTYQNTSKPARTVLLSTNQNYTRSLRSPIRPLFQRSRALCPVAIFQNSLHI